ncbi:zinc-binding dehydrogenase [Halocynthiibacter sp. C4]|uniref:zinc-binding dehydrogenase n=1 Tax=Halocynthiibacter sp. C4 TaxID=2992758 RepID=UPI00237A569C|nr:zinc-binding dehydrogenase [Halocynthiibacter sp. C4]MDE0591497.1 zinc-binding dehydrogenase [Halocynthiibacter sp. C4]
MLAAIHDSFGEPAEVLSARQTDKPEPAAGEALVRMLLSPIHNHDLWTIRGNYGYKPELPGAIGGSEALGIVEAVGEGVASDLIGKRVVAAGVHGTWAEYFTGPAAALLPLPDAIPDEAGAQLVAMPFSAISLLETLKVSEGQWLVQTAANGAVGKIMTGLAKARGIHLLNLVRRQEAADELKAAGVENVLSTDDPDWVAKAQALIGEAGATSAIDSVGGEVGAQLIELLGVDGELIIFGTATGAPLPVSSGALIMKHITVKGFWGSRVSKEMDPDTRFRLIGELVGLAVQGDLPLETGGKFPLSQCSEAMKAALEPGRRGKIMLQP